VQNLPNHLECLCWVEVFNSEICLWQFCWFERTAHVLGVNRSGETIYDCGRLLGVQPHRAGVKKLITDGKRNITSGRSNDPRSNN